VPVNSCSRSYSSYLAYDVSATGEIVESGRLLTHDSVLRVTESSSHFTSAWWQYDPAGSAEAFVDLWFYMQTTTNYRYMYLTMPDDPGAVLRLYIIPGGEMRVYTQGSVWLTIATLSAGQWYHLQMRADASQSPDRLWVWLDGEPVLDDVASAYNRASCGGLWLAAYAPGSGDSRAYYDALEAWAPPRFRLAHFGGTLVRTETGTTIEPSHIVIDADNRSLDGPSLEQVRRYEFRLLKMDGYYVSGPALQPTGVPPLSTQTMYDLSLAEMFVEGYQARFRDLLMFAYCGGRAFYVDTSMFQNDVSEYAVPVIDLRSNYSLPGGDTYLYYQQEGCSEWHRFYPGDELYGRFKIEVRDARNRTWVSESGYSDAVWRQLRVSDLRLVNDRGVAVNASLLGSTNDSVLIQPYSSVVIPWSPGGCTLRWYDVATGELLAAGTTVANVSEYRLDADPRRTVYFSAFASDLLGLPQDTVRLYVDGERRAWGPVSATSGLHQVVVLDYAGDRVYAAWLNWSRYSEFSVHVPVATILTANNYNTTVLVRIEKRGILLQEAVVPALGGLQFRVTTGTYEFTVLNATTKEEIEDFELTMAENATELVSFGFAEFVVPPYPDIRPELNDWLLTGMLGLVGVGLVVGMGAYVQKVKRDQRERERRTVPARIERSPWR